jgi:hypothetical protein
MDDARGANGRKATAQPEEWLRRPSWGRWQRGQGHRRSKPLARKHDLLASGGPFCKLQLGSGGAAGEIHPHKGIDKWG